VSKVTLFIAIIIRNTYILLAKYKFFFFRLNQVVDIATTAFYGIKLNFLPLLHPGISGTFLPSIPRYSQ